MVQEWIAESRLALDQARLLVLKAAWLIDTVGAKGARTEIASIKVAAPRAASYVVDRAVQVSALPASRATRRWPSRGRSCARCTSPTGRTRCTCGRSPARSCAASSRRDAAEDAGGRERVLVAAVELFAANGYDGTSVAQVIARAGVAKGGFYHHFATKEALLYEVYGDLITRQLTRWTRSSDAAFLRPRRCAP